MKTTKKSALCGFVENGDRHGVSLNRGDHLIVVEFAVMKGRIFRDRLQSIRSKGFLSDHFIVGDLFVQV